MASIKVPNLKKFPRETIQLGVLIPDLRSPDQDGTTPPVLEASDSYMSEEKDPKLFYETGSENGLFSRFTKFLSLSQKHKDHRAVDASSATQKEYRLKYPTKTFDQLLQKQDVKNWLEHTYTTRRKAFLIVGILTLEDTKYTYVNQQSSAGSAQAQVPITQAATGIPVGDELDVSAGGHHQHIVKDSETSYIPGEYVFGICYRQVTFKFTMLRQSPAVKVENAKVGGKNKWVTMSATRGEVRDVEELEVIEVSLRDSEDKNEELSGKIDEVQYLFGDE